MDTWESIIRRLEQGVGAVYPAAQLVVVDGGVIVLDEAVGACERSTWFDVASLTKALVTTTLIMQWLERGKLTLDQVLRPPGVTVEQVLAHASGLPAWLSLGEHASLASASRRAAVRRQLTEMALEAPPNQRACYSDLGFILLGEWLAELGAAPLDAQWRSLADELAVAASFHPPADRCAPTHADSSRRGVVHDENAALLDGCAGHAGLFATAREVACIGQALVAAWHADAARRLAWLSPATMRRFWSPSAVPGSTWCLGWDRPAPPPAPSQAGARWPRSGVGHLGFTGCSLWVAPARRRLIVLLSNRVYPSIDNAEDRRSANPAIRVFRPALHDAIVAVLDGDAASG